MDRNALDWLFSTAPQALAALVGLIFTGVSFILGAIDKEIANDATREDICDAMKEEIHSDMKILFRLAGFSIMLDLFLIVLNPIEDGKLFSFHGTFEPYLLIAGLILLLNCSTLIYSLRFIIKVASPNYFEKTVERLSKDKNKGEIKREDFIMEFIELEKVLRALPLNMDQKLERPATVMDILRELKYRNYISRTDFGQLRELNQIRNLIVHGEYIENVDKTTFDKLLYYKKMIIDLNDEMLKTESIH